MIDGASYHLVGGCGRVSPDEPEPVVEGVVPLAPVFVPEIRAQDLGELSEERHDPLAVAARVPLLGIGIVVLGRGRSSGEKLGHELAAESVHVVEEGLLEPGGAGDAVAFDGVRGGVDEGVDLRGAPQDEVRELFF